MKHHGQSCFLTVNVAEVNLKLNGSHRKWKFVVLQNTDFITFGGDGITQILFDIIKGLSAKTPIWGHFRMQLFKGKSAQEMPKTKRKWRGDEYFVWALMHLTYWSVTYHENWLHKAYFLFILCFKQWLVIKNIEHKNMNKKSK